METIIKILYIGAIVLGILNVLRLIGTIITHKAYSGSIEEMTHLMQGKRRNYEKAYSRITTIILICAIIIFAVNY